MASSPPNAILESIGEVKIDWIETNEEHIFKVNAPGEKTNAWNFWTCIRIFSFLMF